MSGPKKGRRTTIYDVASASVCSGKATASSMTRDCHSLASSPRQSPFDKPAADDRGNPFRRPPIAERRALATHRRALGRVLDQTPNFSDDPLRRGPDEARYAGRYALRTFGLVAQDQQWDAQRRRLFLDAPGIAEHEVRIAQA